MLQTDYRKYEFPLGVYETLINNVSINFSTVVDLGELNGKKYVDVLWINGEFQDWLEYEIYPGVDTAHTFLGVNDYQYNTEINRNLALVDVYPHFINKDVTLLQMDNLHNLIRETPLSNKGVKRIKIYKHNNIPVWSIESVYWFDVDDERYNEDGIVKIHTWYSKSGEPLISNSRFIPMSNEDKEKEMKYFRENAINYLKSANPDLFSLLYTYFKEDIITYINVGDKLALETALTSSTEPIIVGTLSYEIPTISGGLTTVLQGILAELL